MYRIKRSVKILKKVKLLKKEQYVEKINQSSLSNQEEDLNWQPDSERDLKRYRRSDSNDERDYDDITSEVELNQELMSAIRSNDLELKKLEKIKNLIQRGAYVNFQDSNVRHNTPLHAAVRKQEVEVVKLLLAEGAIQIKNDNSKIPLDLARRLGKKDIVLQLEKKIVLKRGNTGENKPEVDLPKKPKISFMKESKEIKEENIESKYPASGLKHTLHGSIYQLKLLMLFLKRGLDQGYSFRLATEWDDAEKFDDLVFMYDDSKGKNYRFLQAKHKLDEKNNKITIGDLLTKSKDGEFNLEKYFVSYLRIKKKKEFKDCNLKDFIVCTNIGFDMDNSVQDQVKKLKEVSSGKNKGKKVLVEAIDDYDSFFNTDTGIRYKIKCNDDLVSYLKQGNEVQNEVRGQLVDIIDKEIKEFFKKLVFAVGQPNEVKLGKMLEDEISENFNTRLNYIGQLSKDAYNKFEKAILDWFKEKEGRFFDNEKVKDLFMKMEQEVNSLSILEKEVKNIGQKVSEVHSHIIAGQNNKQVEEHVWFNIKSPSKLFTGREEELNKVHLALQHTKERIGVVSQGSSISGLGGIGKTELAREYVHRYAEEYSNNIIWIDAESYQTLTESFCRLASDKLKINIKNADGIDKQIISIVEDVYKFFANRRSLFIFDNAEKFENLSKFLPLHSFTPEANKPYVLITSRNRNLRAGIEVIDLDKLKLNDSIEFVKKGLFINDELQDQEIKNLVEKLQHFPLAIRQAIAYINDRKVTEEFRVSDYLKEYEIKTKDLLNYKVLHGINDDYIKTTFTTWEVTINKIENYKEYGQLALNILNIMAYFASENISRAMFLSLAGGNEEQLKSAVHLLINYSMVNGEKEQSVLSIHRLVQEVTRLKLQEQQRKKEILREALKLISNTVLREEDMVHVTSILNYSSRYSKLIDDSYLSSTYGEYKDSPLSLLVKSNKEEAVENILKTLKKWNYPAKLIKVVNAVNENGYSPIRFAIENNNLNIIDNLLENGADFDALCGDGMTPLHFVALFGNLELAKHLIDEKNINLNPLDEYGNTPLHTACENDHIELVEYIIGAKLVNPDIPGQNDMTPLHFAAERGSIKLVEYLVTKKVNVNTKDSYIHTPLHLAAKRGYLDVVEYLVKEGAILDVKDYRKNTPLHLAAKNNHLDVVKYLIKEGANCDIKFDYGWTLLHLFARKGNLDGVKLLMENEDFSSYFITRINAHDKNQGTALDMAAQLGHLEIVKLLKEKHASVLGNASFTPLHLAAERGHLDVVEYLVKEGAILDVKDYRKNTPLHLAAKNNHLDVVKYLIKEGANCDIKFDYGWTLLHLFARKGNLDGVKLLMENEDFSSYFITRINAHDKNQGTALDMAAQLGHLEIVKLLKEKHASVLGNASFTPLHLAAERGYLDVVEYLVKEGAILDVKDYRKNTPLHLAIKRGHLDVVKYLVEKGAKVDIKNNRNLTPRDLAKEKFNQNPQIYQEIIGILKSKPINRQQENDNMYQIGEVSAEKCLPSTSGYSGRKRREVGGKECLFTWEDVDEFNVEKDENRDLGKIKIDSEKFVNYIKDLPEGKRSQLIQLADEVRVTGNSQGLVNKLTSNQKVMNHLNRAGRISGMTMHGMMAKNVLADFLNGNYQGVAVNIGFIAGGQGFAKVAEAASIKGLELASKGKFLLSRSLKAASPFLARGTSAFVVYDLINQVKEYKNGTEEALVGIVGDGIYLGVDATEIGIEVAEAFELLEGVSSVTGPIGATIGAVVFVGTDIYMAVKRVDKIDEIIHLTGNEKFVEGLRAFIGMEPQQYIEELMEEKQVNNQLVNQGLEYLQQHSDIKRYIFPTGKSVVDSCSLIPYDATKCIRTLGLNGGRCLEEQAVTKYYRKCTNKFEVDLNNEVLLDSKRTDIKWSRARPGNPNGGELFCLPQGDYEPTPSYGSYLCESAIGVTDLNRNKIGNYTLINLGEGDDYAKGFVNSGNIFVVNDGFKRYYGGNKDDIFILQGSAIKGYLFGEGGINTLDLTGFALNSKNIDVVLNSGDIIYDNHHIFQAFGIDKVIGRKAKAERIFSKCDTQFVDGKGGSERFKDQIEIYDENCGYEMQIVVRPNTVIHNRALEGNFHYTVPYGLGSAKVDFIYSSEDLNVNNTFTFEYEPVEIKNINVRNINVLNKTSHVITFNFAPMSNKEFNITISGASNPSYRLGSGSEIKVGNKGNLYMLQNTNQSIDEIIKSYLSVANRLNKMSFFIQSLPNDETVVIGSGNYEVIHNNPLYKSHLVGNGGENVYVIDSRDKKLEVPEVVIYDLDVESSVDTIDLRNLVQQARGKLLNKESFELKIIKLANDLLLKGEITELKKTEDSFVSGMKKHECFTVRLKDGVNWHDKAHIILNNVPMGINFDNNEWSLKPLPLVFERDKEIIIVNSQDIEENTELRTAKRAGNYKFVSNNGNDLVITNAFDANVAKNDLCTIVLSKFYETPKMETLSIKFADKEITLKDHQEEINTARDINVVKKEYKDQVYNDVFNKKRSTEVILSDQPIGHKHRHEHKRRHRRHHHEQDLSHAVGELSNQAVSSSTRLSSRINDLFGWIKNSIGGLFNSRVILVEEKPKTTSSISQVDTRADVNSAIMLLDVLVRKITGQKYISTVEQQVPLLEARGYALNITERFEKVVEQAAKGSKISMHRLNIDYMGMQKEITRKVMSGKFNEISGILKSYVEKACPGKEAGKLSSKKFDKFIAQFNNGLLNQSIEQILHDRDGTLEVGGAKKQQMSLEPQSYLSNASVQSHSKVSTCLSEIGVTKLGGNLNR